MKKHIKLISIIVLLLIIIISGTYAFYNVRLSKNGSSTANITTKKLSINFQDGPEIELNGVLPGQKIIKTFSVTNTGNTTQTYHLDFVDVVNEFSRTTDLVYTVTSTNSGASINETVFPTFDRTFATNIEIPANTTQEYTMVVEYKNLSENQSIDMNKKLSATIQVTEIIYTGDYEKTTAGLEKYTVPKTGLYLLETWGASGADATSTYIGGYGGYSAGYAYLEKGTQLDLVVGGEGGTYEYTYNEVGTALGGYNGGGNGSVNESPWPYRYLYAGGGATHIALSNNQYDTLASYGNSTTADNYVLLVAGGGGSGSSQQINSLASHTTGGSGGGTTGGAMIVNTRTGSGWSTNIYSDGGSQTACGTTSFNSSGVTACGFGAGASATNASAHWGGGGGWYGGNVGSGGSGHINDNLVSNGHMTCYNCMNQSDNVTTVNTCFSDTATTDCAKDGNGAVKVTFLGNKTLKTISFVTSENEISVSDVYVLEGTLLGNANLDYSDINNYEIIDYYLDSNYQNSVSDNLNYAVNNDITLYAKLNYAFKSSLAEAHTVTVPKTGIYKLEVWGAQGGSYDDDYTGGLGGYATGTISLTAGDTLYAYVGGTTEKCNVQYCAGGFNGGGRGAGSNHPVYSTGGGGASHIATASGLINQVLANNSSSVLLVAGGGGGTSYQFADRKAYTGLGGNGGGIQGNSGTNTQSGFNPGTGGTQLAGGTGNTSGSLGLGADANQYSAGGGGGYYGGGSSNQSGAGGGSGYINTSRLNNAKMVCKDCTPSDIATTKTETNNCSNEVPTPDCSKIGNGAVKITYLGN